MLLQLTAVKKRCVEKERYRAAAQLKECEQQLATLGGRLAQLRERKATALAREEYEGAEEVKLMCEDVKKSIAKVCNVALFTLLPLTFSL